MEITRAYKTLADYYRKHGSTPSSLTPAPTTPIKSPETQVPREYTARAAAEVDASTADAQTHSSSSIAPVAAQWKVFAILTAIVLLLYLWFPDAPPERDRNTGNLSDSAAQSTSRPDVDEKAMAHPTERFFTIGSMLGEVYAIQGIPSKTEEGTWHYGKSRVYFINGSVSHWDSHPDNPLYASFDVVPATTGKAFIQRGSTKAEVRAIQGMPWHQTEREWTYGSSRIYFSGDIVTGWDESIRNPLKIQK